MKYLLIIFISMISTIYSSIKLEHYGQKVEVAGWIEQREIFDPNEEAFKNFWFLKLDDPIEDLPTPQIGNEKRDQNFIQEVILYLPAGRSFKRNMHITLKGSIWYADWLNVHNPFLFIVDETTNWSLQ